MNNKDYEILRNEPLSKYSYMKTGGLAKKIVFPLTETEFKKIVKEEKAYILGNCSNVLFPDEGIDKTIIITTKLKNISISHEGDFSYISAQTGATLSSVARLALDNSLTGFEFAHGIPGTVGGAVFMNAGAYGGEIKDVFHSCVCLDENGEETTLYPEDMNFEYRKSIMQEKPLILIKAIFKLKKGEKSEIKALMDDLMERRRTKQPLEYHSVGSFFKRPEGYFAAKLIEDSGLKGFSVGGAQVSEKHSGFVINKGGATTKDILELSKHVKKTVYDKFGVTLEEEVRVLNSVAETDIE
jgi:UDP-N-acetylmuramate dehydrogenase